MKRKFKFLGSDELNAAGEKVKTGMNFGRFGYLNIGDVIEATEDEASNIALHDKFEEVVAKSGKAASN